MGFSLGPMKTVEAGEVVEGGAPDREDVEGGGVVEEVEAVGVP